MNEEMRKEFEEFYWKENNHSFSDNLTKDMLFKIGIIEGNYFDNEVRVAFYWWQASRQAMKPIEFPAEIELDLIGDQVAPTHQNSYAEGYNDALSDLELKITELGYKVE